MYRQTLLATTLVLAACIGTPATDPSFAGQPGPAAGGPSDGVFPSMLAVRGDIVGGSGEQIGEVTGQYGPHGLLLQVSIGPGGLEPGWHGLHLHQTGDCSDTGVFKASGGHVGKIEDGHGLLNPSGPEGGDLPNIWAGADGAAGYEAFSPFIGSAAFADADGVALIIHEGRDDHLTQPIGGAGARVACAVVR